MNRTPTDDERELLKQVETDWLRVGLSTTPAERERIQWTVLSAYEAIGHGTGSHLFIWVDSPMAGVIASTFVGFALNEPLKPKLMKQLKKATSAKVPAAQQIRKDVDQHVWHTVRNAVHKQVAAELETREANADWQQMKENIGNYAWDQVWQTVGDPIYDHMFGDDMRASDGLFDENLKPWADAMMEGQFSAGTMAQLDALSLLTDLDIGPFKALQRIAQNTCWWWAFDLGAVLCERPTTIDVNGKRVTMEFRDGWRVGY